MKGPLANNYVSAIALVVFALTPYLALSTALTPLSQVIAKDVGLSEQSFKQTPALEPWLEGERPAIESPALLKSPHEKVQRLRRRVQLRRVRS